jgi:hypothetical protein
MQLNCTILDHHLIEFVSKSELAHILEQIGDGPESTKTGQNYVLHNQSEFLFFFTAKDGSCCGEWSDTNCSDHIMIYATAPDGKPARYELALSHMSLTGFELKLIIKNYIVVMVALMTEHEIQHGGLRKNSHSKRPTLESVQAAFQFPYRD